MSFFRKNMTKKYFVAETGDFNLFVRPIAKYDFQRQSFTNTVTQCWNIVQMWFVNLITNQY